MQRASFGSKIGAILAAAGSAVGLGNIWRFPYETGSHGGAAFILVYLACVFLLGLPIMIAEFAPSACWHPAPSGSGLAPWACCPGC